MINNATVIGRDGNGVSYPATLMKGDRLTAIFAKSASNQIPEGGISICYNQANVTKEAIAKAKEIIEYLEIESERI